MCVVSMVGDHFSDKFKQPGYDDLLKRIKEQWQQPIFPIQTPLTDTSITITNSISTVTKQEFDALKKEVEDMKALLKRAKIYDEQNNEPNCEMEDKVQMLKKVAELMGVSLDEIFGHKKQSE